MRSLLVALALALVAARANAYEVERDSTGAITTWKAPLHFVVDEDLAQKLKTPGAAAAVSAALDTIKSAVPAMSIDSAAGKPHGIGYDFDHPEQSTSDVMVPEDWKFDENAVAITMISVNRTTHAIIETDIAFNAQHTAFGVVAGDQAADRYDVQNAMTHELGHALGLAHTPTHMESVMYPHSVPGEISKRTLAGDDLDGLHFLYPAPLISSAAAPGVQGCSAIGTAPFALFAVAMFVTLRRRRAAIALASVFVAASVAPVFAAQTIASHTAWMVSSIRTQAPGAGPWVLESEVTVTRDGTTRTVRMLGGRFGDVEQIVDGLKVPSEGDAIELGADDRRPVSPAGY